MGKKPEIRSQRSETGSKIPALNRFLRIFGYSMLAMFVLACVAQPAFSQGRKSRTPHTRRGDLPPAKADKIEDWEEVVEGRGMTAEIAEQVALIKARDAVMEFAHKHSHEIQHPPPDEFIKNELAERSPAEIIEADDNLSNVGKYLVRLKLTVTDEKFRKMLAYDHQLAQEEHDQIVQLRLSLLGKLLLAIVAVLCAVVCYARLEEITKGYYTAWLRLAALGFVGAVGIGLWLFS